jgi:hypothetical protein
MEQNISIREHQYSIIVVGAMNPRIHYPLWYRIAGIISEAEEAAALASPSLVLVPVFARFETGGFMLGCQEERWEIFTTDPGVRGRILEVAAKVFGKLHETPIRAFGLNTKLHLETAVPDVSRCLAGNIESLGIEFPAGGKPSGAILFSSGGDNVTHNVDVRPSHLSNDLLFVGRNSHYELGGQPEYFDMGKLLAEHFDADYEASVAQASKLRACRRTGRQ